ncbi:MAG: sugar transferase, partial [Propionibacteriaceae bacterium]
AVLRAWVTVIVAGALVAELVPGLRLEQREALLKLCVAAAPLALALSLLSRLAGRHLLRRAQRRGRLVRRVVVVGTASAVAELSERLGVEPDAGMQLVGMCVPDAARGADAAPGLPVLGNLHQVAAVVAEHDCDTVAVTSDGATRSTYLRELSWALEGTGTEMLVDPGLVEVAGPRMHIRPLVGFPLLHIEAPHFKGPRRVVKRTADIALSSFGALLISPVLVAVALSIKLQDGGPVLFRQERVGRGGRPFWMYKFRSMRVGAERELASLMEHNEGKGGLFKLGADPRITRLGRVLRAFSLDELPQLLNVLNGSMSLVGPRPHLRHELELMPPHAIRRSLVTPGMTGLWQINGRSDLEGNRAIQLDLRYVENWSLTLDLVILWRTFSAVLRRSGAS